MHDRDDPTTTPGTTHVCPYCGLVSAAAPETCPQCQMRDTPETRAATTARVGPWYVLQPKNPASPGMNFSTLLSLVRRGRVTPASVVRGPTTQQLWAPASKVKGLSREFGICYACGGALERASNLCPHCQRLQDPPMNPDALLEHKPTAGAPPAPSSAAVRPPHRPRQPAPVASPPAPPEVGLPPGTLATTLPGAGPAKGRILTPRELAAAFALDVPPGEAGGPAASGTTTPAPTDEEPARRHPVRAVLLTAFLFAIATFGVYVVVDPDFRAEVRARLVWAGEWAKAHLAAPTTSSSSARPALRPVAPAARGTAMQASHREAAAAPPPPAATVSATTSKARGPEVQAEPRAAPAPAVHVDVGPPVGAVATPPPRVEVSKPTADEPKDAATPEAVAKSIELFRAALEAESEGDYPRAVKFYEAIKGLPREAWPATLERRLTSARTRAGEG